MLKVFFFWGGGDSNRVNAAQKKEADGWKQRKIKGNKNKNASKMSVCFSKHTQIQSQGQPLQYPAIQYRKKQSRFYLCVHTHIFKGTNTHPNEWVKCFSPKQRWLQYMGNTPTTFPFPPSVIFFLSACSLSLFYIAPSMSSYNNAVMTQIIHFTTPPYGSHFFSLTILFSPSPSDLSFLSSFVSYSPQPLLLSLFLSSFLLFHPSSFSSPRLLLPLITRKCKLSWAPYHFLSFRANFLSADTSSAALIPLLPLSALSC